MLPAQLALLALYDYPDPDFRGLHDVPDVAELDVVGSTVLRDLSGLALWPISRLQLDDCPGAVVTWHDLRQVTGLEEVTISRVATVDLTALTADERSPVIRLRDCGEILIGPFTNLSRTVIDPGSQPRLVVDHTGGGASGQQG